MESLLAAKVFYMLPRKKMYTLGALLIAHNIIQRKLNHGEMQTTTPPTLGVTFELTLSNFGLSSLLCFAAYHIMFDDALG